MRTSDKIFGAVLALVAAFITMHFVFSPDPEAHAVASNDGMVEILGLTRQRQRFSFNPSPVLPSVAFPLYGTAYELLPNDETYDVPVTITWNGVKEGTEIYRWSEAWSAWSSLPDDEVRIADDRATITTRHLGLFMQGDELSVATPVFLDAIDELLAKAPAHAVSYRVGLVAHLLSPDLELGASILLDDLYAQGGCGSVPHHGRDNTQSTVARTANVLVNDVVMDVDFQFIAHWESDDDGCPADRPLQSIEVRDTL